VSHWVLLFFYHHSWIVHWDCFLFHRHLSTKIKTLQLRKNQWQKAFLNILSKNLACSAGPLSLEKVGERRYYIEVWWIKPGLSKRAVISNRNLSTSD
jgi:hypothetical protein